MKRDLIVTLLFTSTLMVSCKESDTQEDLEEEESVDLVDVDDGVEDALDLHEDGPEDSNETEDDIQYDLVEDEEGSDSDGEEIVDVVDALDATEDEVPSVEAGNCDDGIDNDLDGCTDTTDSECGGVETACSGGVDDDCDGLTDCTDSDCASDPSCYRIVFATSSQHRGNLDGLAGADTICNTLASAAGLTGTFMAWLSDGTQSPSTRFTRSMVPYVLVDGTIVANNWVDLTDGTLENAINMSEAGGSPARNAAWTGTVTDGTADPLSQNCSNWTSSATGVDGLTGSVTAIFSEWSNIQPLPCNFFESIYCFQQ